MFVKFCLDVEILLHPVWSVWFLEWAINEMYQAWNLEMKKALHFFCWKLTSTVLYTYAYFNADWISWSSSCTGYHQISWIWSKKLILKVSHFSSHFNTCWLFLNQRCTWDLYPGGARIFKGDRTSDILRTFQRFLNLDISSIFPS